jgi:hypothetical protein
LYQEDLDDKATAATITGAVSGAIPIVGAVGRKLISGSRAKQMEKLAETTRALIAEGYKPTQALRSAMWEVRPSVAAIEQYGVKDLTTKAIKKSMQKRGALSPQAVADTLERKILAEGTYYGRLKSVVGEATAPAKKLIEKTITPLASRFERMGLPRIAAALRHHDMESHIMIQNRLTVKDQLMDAVKDMSKGDKRALKKALLNGDEDLISSLAAKNRKIAPNLQEAIHSVRSMLDNMHNESVAQGVKVGYIKNFFPREIKDYRAFAARRGIPYSRITEELARAINKKHSLSGKAALTRLDINNKVISESLSDREVADIIANKVFKGKGEASTDFMTKHGFSRTKEFVEDADLEDYAELGDSLTNYIVGTTTRNQTRKFFGGGQGVKGTEEQVTAIGVKAFVDDLVKQGRVLGDDVADVHNMMTQRFVSGSRSPARAMQGTKNILYSATLGNPFAAATQLADLGAAAYLNSFSTAIPAVVKSLTRGKSRVRLEDLGLDTLAHELEHVGTTAKILQFSLKKGGFAAVDRLGKETILNATLNKLSKQSLSSAGRKKIINKYRETYTPAQMRKLLDDLRSGTRSEEVKMALWTELSKVQPISLSEMPEYYLKYPNGRIFYMLKTFTLKQLDLVRREAFDQIARGKVAEGTANLVRLGAIIGMANGGVEQAKGFVTGKDVDFEDAFFANILRNYALSEWTLDKVKKGQPVDAAIDYATPPISILQDPFRDIAEGFKNMRTLKDIPVFGKALWYFLGYGEED